MNSKLIARITCFLDSQLDVFPNQLTPSEDDLCLVDAAYFINTSCPPLLRKERNVNIILSFDYSLSTAFEVFDLIFLSLRSSFF